MTNFILTKRDETDVNCYCSVAAARDIPVGVEDGRLPDVAFSASSQWNAQYAPHQGRLNHIRSKRDFGSWIARYNNRCEIFARLRL